MNFQLLSKQRKFILFFSAIGIISMFLPWVSISMFGSSQSVNGMHDKGIIVFLCFLLSGFIAVKDNQQIKLDKTMWAVTLLASALALILTFWFYSEATSSILGPSLVSFGLYLAGISAAGVALSAYLMKAPENNLRDGFNTLKVNLQRRLANSSHIAKNSDTSVTLTDNAQNNVGENENINPVL